MVRKDRLQFGEQEVTVPHRSGLEEESWFWEELWASMVHDPEGLLSQTPCNSLCLCVRECAFLWERLWTGEKSPRRFVNEGSG